MSIDAFYHEKTLRRKHSSKLGSATPPKLGSKPIDKGGGEMAILNAPHVYAVHKRYPFLDMEV